MNDNIVNLNAENLAKVNSLKENDRYKKEPNTITRTRNRLDQSIQNFENYEAAE